MPAPAATSLLPSFPITHAHLGAGLAARSTVRYLRFLREVTVDRLELSPLVYGRWAPSVPTHPAHLVVSSLEAAGWRVVADVDLPYEPGIAGQGLSQSMDLAAMEEHFHALVPTLAPRVIPLGGITTRTLRVECDREHPVWPSHGECNGNPAGVPFGILDTLAPFGPEPAAALPQPAWQRIMEVARMDPRAPRGMDVQRNGEMILYTGRRFSVGFSLRRPVLLHLGWDASGARAGASRLSARRVGFRDRIRGVSGPLLVDFDGDYGSHRWTGVVAVQGNRVSYTGLHAVDGLTVDAVFTVEPDGLILELHQRALPARPAAELECWRLAFQVARGMTAVAGIPLPGPGRAGGVGVPAFLAGDGNGALAVRGAPEAAAMLQVESYRATGELTAGIVLGPAAAPGAPLLATGEHAATVELRVTSFQPEPSPRARPIPPGLRRHWSSQFSCFRPEWGGFSNNALSVHCNQNQHTPIDIAVFTRVPENGPDPAALARFTVGRALAGAGAYGYWRSLYLDSDPVLVSSAGRIHQVRPDSAWLRSIEEGLAAAARRILSTLDAETGLCVCRELSGNAGSFRWSCNAWDIVGFGHIDAYVNAWSYRGLRNAAALLADLGQADLSARCREAAASIRTSYGPVLINPATGWVACWKSRDGALHDYAAPLVNGPACAFGVIGPEEARRAMGGLEALRDERGMGSARLGIPFTLLPLDPRDHLLPAIMGGGATEPTFEVYTDGSVGAMAAAFYLRALSLAGMKDRALRAAQELDESFARDVFTGPPGGIGDGRELQTWEGLTSGYEGTFGLSFGPLYAVAVEHGVITPPSPEWWPENG